jgi:glycosyltransferase involved in cell wall biosynthesis
VRVAVVVPFHAEPTAQLEQCIASVLEQTHPSELVLVGDGPSSQLASTVALMPPPKNPRMRVIWLPTAHGDFGNTARAIGALDAIGDGVDVVQFLDADNWLAPDHVAKMLALHGSSGAPICTASRWLARLDGTVMGVCKESDGEQLADTSTLFIAKPAFPLLPLWGLLPKSLAPIGDRVWFMLARASKLPRAHNPEPTQFYRTRYAAHYRAIGEAPPPEAKEVPDLPPGDYHLEFPALRLGLQIDRK